MSTFSEWLMPAGVLVQGLNVAIASSVVCAMAIVLSRRASWSLPVRHGLLVAALAVGLLAPLVLPLFPVPSNWSFRVSGQDAAVVDPAPVGAPALTATAISRQESLEPAVPITQHADEEVAMASPVALSSVAQSSIAPSTAVPSSATASVVIPPTPVREPLSMGVFRWATMMGTLLSMIWLAGVVVGLGRATSGLLKLRRWVQSVSISESSEIATAAQMAAQGVGLKRDVAVYCSSVLPAPVTCGLLKPRIVVPAGIESSLSYDQLRAVIQHEMAHVARRDLWIGLLQQVAQILYWWNPLVRLANRDVADLREQICDDIATRELSQPDDYAATLIEIAERCTRYMPVPATLGIGSSSVPQLELRIRRIMSSPNAKCLGLTRRASVGVCSAALLMTATALFAQIQVETPKVQSPSDAAQPAQTKWAESTAKPAADGDKVAADSNQPKADAANQAQTNPTVAELIEAMAKHEKASLPFEVKTMETYRIPEGLTLREQAEYPWADGRKHQTLMEYAQLKRRVYRIKETHLIDDETTNSHETFCEGERTIGVSMNTNSKTIGKPEVYINPRPKHVFNYLYASSLQGVFCLSGYTEPELFSDYYRANEKKLTLTWVEGNAKLTCMYSNGESPVRFDLWLSRAHAWHPIRLQRYFQAKDPVWFSEWEATKFVQIGNQWHASEGTQRYRHPGKLLTPEPKLSQYSDFKVLEQKYGADVNPQQFQYTIPAGAVVREEKPKPKPDPVPPPVPAREITVTVVDIAGKPIPQASVRIGSSTHVSELDRVTTDENGIARSKRAPVQNTSVQITADGMRPVTWIVGEGDLKAIMTPISTGIVVDERGNPVANVWISNAPIQMRADGIPYFAAGIRERRSSDVSDNIGQFKLTSELTVRRSTVAVPLIAIDEDCENMAVQLIPVSDLGQKQSVVLRPVCAVTGHCVLQGVTESQEIRPSLETRDGQRICDLTTKTVVTPTGLRVDFELRLPPGEYALKARQSSEHAGFEIPFTIPVNQKVFDFGTKDVALAGTSALKGKPAPPLDVNWRPGQQATWEGQQGQVTVLYFWSTWSVPYIRDVPEMQALHNQFRDKPVKWLAIQSAGVTSFEEFDKQMAKLREDGWIKDDFPFTTVLEQPGATEKLRGKTGSAYSVTGRPTLIVIDQKGNVVGAVRKEKLSATIDRLLGEGANK